MDLYIYIYIMSMVFARSEPAYPSLSSSARASVFGFFAGSIISDILIC